MSAFSFYTSFNCPACGHGISFRYESSRICACGNCGAQIEKDKEKESVPGELIPEDLSPFQTGTRGKWQEKNFEITGRVRFEFEDKLYLNWWHLESGTKTFGWIAESYGVIFLMQDFKLPVSFSAIEKVKPGYSVKIGEENFQMSSFGKVTEWIIEGELPERPEPVPYLWVDLENDAAKAIDIQVFDRTHIKAYLGVETGINELSLTNLRSFDGWNG